MQKFDQQCHHKSKFALKSRQGDEPLMALQSIQCFVRRITLFTYMWLLIGMGHHMPPENIKKNNIHLDQGLTLFKCFKILIRNY